MVDQHAAFGQSLLIRPLERPLKSPNGCEASSIIQHQANAGRLANLVALSHHDLVTILWRRPQRDETSVGD
ncbi:hypothetical protein HYQ45_014552 [Verticillium longisporum]|uniref:Uncharacterized protein n=1 Tax=Verticillium longisporum TaxID=100787 RepID=A0A8I2ZAJ7_VERLO|nr:hypothetical protein HYQ45_014552 [Verticillium longisporum]